MAWDRARMEAIRESIAERLEDVLTKPKPNYDIDGQKVDWADYLERLQKSLDWIEKQLATAEGPFQTFSQVLRADGC